MIERGDQFTAAWSAHRRFLLDVAYRLLGSVADAEDVVQEAFARLLRAVLDSIADVRGWLVVVVSRLCLDQLRSARVRREAYLGPRFPEPLLGPDGTAADPADLVTLDESVRMALLIVLDRLTPAERVVFVLHDVFAFTFEQIAPMVGRTPAACRQLASRARKRVKDDATSDRFVADRAEQRRVVDAFIAACASGEVESLLPLLDPSVIGWADVGGLAAAAVPPTVGPEAVARGALRYFGPATGTRLVARDINGEPGVVAIRRRAVFAVLALTVLDGRITRLYSVADPRKLARARRAVERGA